MKNILWSSSLRVGCCGNGGGGRLADGFPFFRGLTTRIGGDGPSGGGRGGVITGGGRGGGVYGSGGGGTYTGGGYGPNDGGGGGPGSNNGGFVGGKKSTSASGGGSIRGGGKGGSRDSAKPPVSTGITTSLQVSICLSGMSRKHDECVSGVTLCRDF